MQASLRSRAVPFSAALAVVASLATPVLAEPPGRPDRDGVVLWLTILHNNDAESKLIDAGGAQFEPAGDLAGIGVYETGRLL